MWRETQMKTSNTAVKKGSAVGLSDGRSKLLQPHTAEYDKKKPRRVPKVPPAALASMLRNLGTLQEIGVPLAKGLATLSQEPSFKKYAPLLDGIRRGVESGDPFSSAITAFSSTFNEVMVNQIRAGERAGVLAETFAQISKQLDQTSNIRSQIIRKLSYPTVLVVAGTLAIGFLLMFVVPLFQRTYDEIGIPLPMVTLILLAAGNWARSYGWIVPLVLVAVPLAIRQARRDPALATRIDQAVLRLPLLGNWLRNMALLQFIEVFGNLVESGFTVVESLRVSARVVKNRVMRKGIEELQVAVMRGERFSRELNKRSDIFPPVVNQLIVIGEQTGNLKTVTPHIWEHLRREIEDSMASPGGGRSPHCCPSRCRSSG